MNEPNTFTCYLCHGTFQKGWSDEEAMKEYAEKFPDSPEVDKSPVCDDCAKKVDAWLKTLN